MQLQFAIAIGQNILDFTEHTIFGHKTKQFVGARRHKILKIIETYVKYVTDNNLLICTNETKLFNTDEITALSKIEYFIQ